jgi:hypothetical protein
MMQRRAGGALLPLLAALAWQAGCIYLVDDPTDWSVADQDAGAAGASGTGVINLECYQTADSCSCSPSTSGGAVHGCNRATLGNDFLCCADLQYPQKNTDCSCQQLSCKRDTYGCDCFAGSSYGPDSSCSPHSDEICCVSDTSCSCSIGRACDTEHTVSHCDASKLSCGSKQALPGCSN